MNWFYNLKTAYKLALGFTLCLVFTALVGGIAIQRMARMNASTHSILTDTVPSDITCGQMLYSATRFRVFEFHALVSFMASDKKGINTVDARMSLLQQDMDATIDSYSKRVDSDQDKHDLEDVKASWAAYLASHQKFLALSRANQTKDAAVLLNGPMLSQFDTLHDRVGTIVNYNTQHGEAQNRQAQSAYNSGRTIIIGLLALAVVLGTLTSLTITRYITGTLKQVSGRLEMLNAVCVTNLGSAIQALEQGDLTAKIVTGTEPLNIHAKDEFGHMAGTFNVMLDQVKNTVASFRKSQASLSALVGQMQMSAVQINGAADTLAGTSQQIGAVTEEISATMNEVAQASEQSARGAGEIAQGSASQAASVAEGAEQVKELAAAVLGVAHEAEAAGKAVDQATQTAAAGTQAVEQTVAGMRRIQGAVSQSSQVIASLGQTSVQIGGIVNTIDEIAGQTNLLALNTAIEAARAGEAGRGFAVVADEVRKLAERCTTATKDIGALIGEIQRQTDEAVTAMESGTREVTAGTALAGEAGAALERIGAVVQEMSGRVLGISAASEEMSASAQGVTQTISEVAAVIEQSSAAAEEMSASSEQVSASVQTVAGTTAQQEAAVEELVASASELSGIAHTLSELVAQFRVESADNEAHHQAGHSAQPALTLRKVA